MTAHPHAQVRFRRAIERRALWLAEDAAREFPNLPLEDAIQLVHLYDRNAPSNAPVVEIESGDSDGSGDSSGERVGNRDDF